MTEAKALFKTSEAAKYVGFSAHTLNQWRSNGMGPPYTRIGAGSVRYRLVTLDEWINAGDVERVELEAQADCHQEQKKKAKRARGRFGAEQRQRRLAAEPYCRDCFGRGVTREAWEVDHVIPLSQGGRDTDDNVRCLCGPCHKERTRQSKLAEIEWSAAKALAADNLAKHK